MATLPVGARQAAHAHYTALLDKGYRVPDCAYHPDEGCDVECRALTADIAARDASWAEEVRVLREGLGRIDRGPDCVDRPGSEYGECAHPSCIARRSLEQADRVAGRRK